MTNNSNNNDNKNYTADGDEVRPFDVLLGRGGATNNNEGNKRFRSIVALHQKEYLLARKKEKIVIAHRIVALVHENGGRFLKRDTNSDVWVEVPNKRAQEKTSQALREGLDVRNSSLRPGGPSSMAAAARARNNKRSRDGEDSTASSVASVATEEVESNQTPDRTMKAGDAITAAAAVAAASGISPTSALIQLHANGAVSQLSLNQIPDLREEYLRGFVPSSSVAAAVAPPSVYLRYQPKAPSKKGPKRSFEV